MASGPIESDPNESKGGSRSVFNRILAEADRQSSGPSLFDKLKEQQGDDSWQAAERIANHFSDVHGSLRTEAAKVEAEIIQLLEDSTTPTTVRRAAAQLAWHIDTPEMLNVMSSVISEGSFLLSKDVARWFTLSKQPEAEQKAIAMLESDEPRQQRLGAWALNATCSEEGEEALLRVLRDENSSISLQVGALRAFANRFPDGPDFIETREIGSGPTPPFSPDVMAVLKDKLVNGSRWQVRKAALEALPHDPFTIPEFADSLLEASNKEAMEKIKLATLKRLSFCKDIDIFRKLAARGGEAEQNILLQEARKGSQLALELAAELVSEPQNPAFALGSRMFEQATHSGLSSRASKNLLHSTLDECEEPLLQAFENAGPGQRADLVDLFATSRTPSLISIAEDYLKDDSARRAGVLNNAIATASVEFEDNGTAVLQTLTLEVENAEGLMAFLDRQKLIVSLADAGSELALTELIEDLKLTSSPDTMFEYLSTRLVMDDDVKEELRRNLQDTDEEGMKHAANHLGSVAGRSTTTPLLQVLLNRDLQDHHLDILRTLATHQNASLRGDMSKSLQAAGLTFKDHPEIVQELLGYLACSDERKKAFALTALSGSPEETLQNMTLASATNEDSERVGNALVDSIGKFQSSMLSAFVTEYLGDADAGLGGDADIKMLIKLPSAMKNINFTKAQIRGLESIASDPKMDMLHREVAFVGLTQDRAAYFRAAVETLAQIPEELPRSNAEKESTAEDMARRLNVLKLSTLGHLDQLFGVSDDFSASGTEEDEAVKVELIERLIETVDLEPDLRLRERAAEVLQGCYELEPGDIARMIELANDRGREMARYLAIKALGSAALAQEEEMVRPVLEEILDTTDSGDVSAEVIHAFSQFDDGERIAEEVFEALGSDSPKVVRAAYTGLSPVHVGTYDKTHCAKQIVPLTRLMLKGDEGVQIQAAHLILDQENARQGKFVAQLTNPANELEAFDRAAARRAAPLDVIKAL